MTQRIYWVPHTVCPFGCLHCHNDSTPDGLRSSRALIDRIIAHLPSSDSAYRLEDVLVGGGEGLARGTDMEYLVRSFRERFSQGAQATADERRAAGSVILALQTAGPPLADGAGAVVPERVDHWLELGVDYFQVASSDMFHRSRQPGYPWDALETSMRSYSAASGVEFRIYGKEVTRLVPSGRVLQNLAALRRQGAALLTEDRYCADGWETGSNFISGQSRAYPECSEAVIDPQGWVHPCCWYLMSPGLFDLGAIPFEVGMRALREQPLCHAIDQGDMLALAELAGVSVVWTRDVCASIGDCGLCRLVSIRLSQRGDHAWIKAQPLTALELQFYREQIGATALDA